MLDATKHTTDDKEDSTHVHRAYSTVQLQQRCRLIHHLSEKCDFCFPVLQWSAEAQVIWGGILKHLLIACFIGNIPVKNIKIRLRVSKLWQIKGGTFFRDTVYIQPCLLIILLILSSCQIPICSLFCLFALHLAPAASALQLRKSGTLSLQLFECVLALILVVISRSTISDQQDSQSP